MSNSSRVSSFFFSAYGDLTNLNYLYFSIVLVLYLLIIILNVMFIVVVYLERGLHQPMYIFMCNLSCNGLYGSTALCPLLLKNIISETHEISRASCLAQIFSIHSYGSFEFTILTVMSYDRYVSICYPLQYSAIMSPFKIGTLIVLIYVYNIFSVSITLSLTSTLQLCGNIIDKIYCDNYPIVKLACTDTTALNIYYLINLAITICTQVLLIICSYVRIFQVCIKVSKNSQAKAMATCAPQMLIVINYGIACSFELIQNRFNMKHLPTMIRIILSVYFLILPPLFICRALVAPVAELDLVKSFFLEQANPDPVQKSKIIEFSTSLASQIM
ncbi:olfactory receptor 6K3-like [Erpetoichthys calabaricus]|uniref:olfactory receptor 6K3-like n=1 Tax=Erpetoichthys calabaricus TaxID=27687 RepID=UPI0022348D5C|nr:olfactory receptor 6K3-like [Erpetoichthys calabaricus]